MINKYIGGTIMSSHSKAIVISLFLVLVILLTGDSLGVVATPTLTINQLVTSGQTVTLQAPSGDYLYTWTAETGGSNIGTGTAQKFSFTAPLVSQEDGSKVVTVYLYIRTIEGGCVNQTSTDISVYALPVCGISGPGLVGPYDVSTYTYSGGTTGQLSFVWTVDGSTIDGANGPSINIDWSQYNVVNHTIGMTLTKDYSDVAPGSTNPFRSISCKLYTNVTYTTGMELAKTASPTTASVGDTVTYTYTVRNTGTIGINSLTLTDNKLGTIVLSPTTILPGGQATGTKTYVIAEKDLPGPLNNTAIVSGKEDRTNKPTNTTANATVDLTYNAALALTKEPSTTNAAVGETVTYTYTIENTGKVTINDLNLTDDKLGTINTAKDSLASGETTTGTVTYVVKETDLPGPLVNRATIAGTDIQNKEVTAEATASVDLTYKSGLALTKTASSGTAAVGDTINYEYSVTNNGTVTINGLTLNDDKLGAIALLTDTLAPGATTTGSASYVVLETDLPGPLVNNATVAGTDRLSRAVNATAKESVELTYTSSMDVTKTPSSSTANVGDTINYAYTVKNTGSVTINSLALEDDKLGAIVLNATTLAPGATATGTATHTVVEADLPGPLTNNVTATGTNVLGTAITAQDKATVQLTYTAALQVTKTPSSDTAAVGETVTYQYSVVNTGNVTINGLTLVDDKLGSITLSTDTLAPGETATGSATHTIVQADLPGPLTNVATAAGTDVLGKDVTSQGTATVDLTYTATLDVVKTPSSNTAAVGDTVIYTYSVTNSGTVNITALALSDDKLGTITLDKTSLGPGETATGSASYTVLETDLPGPLTNRATVTAKDRVGKTVTGEASASVELTYAASMTIVKTPSTSSAAVGDTITYTYTVENTGKVTINDLEVIDDRLGTVTMAKLSLQPGETTTGTATHLVLETDIPGPLINNVTATATDRLGQPVTSDDTATVDLTYTATLAVTKAASPQSAAIGDTVTYTFTVTNAGKVTIRGLNLSDDKLGPIALVKDTLAPGESITATVNHILVEADLPSPLTNVVTVTGRDIQGQTVTSTATATVAVTYTSSAITLTKVASSRSAKVGDTVTYTYTISNNNKVTISSLSLVDDKIGTITLTQDSVAPGGTITATATYIIAVGDVPGPVINNATLSGKDPAGNSVGATAKATVAITRDRLTPVLNCVMLNDDGTYTAFFGYENPNSYAVTVPIGNDNKITAGRGGNDQGQPTTFDPGSQDAVFGVVSDGNAIVWHLENTVATANKNSPGCSQAECGLEGPALCRNREETYSYNVTEDPKFTQSYSWSVDDTPVTGTDKSIVLNGADYEEGVHDLSVTVTRYYKGLVWSTKDCSMTLKVIPEPSAEISMEET